MVDKMSPLDHSKAERELGWKPAPFEDSIRNAVAFYRSHGMPEPQRESSRLT